MSSNNNQSEGKFLNKLKNTFRKDSASSSKSNSSDKSATSSKEGKILNEAHKEGEHQAIGNTNAASGAGAGAGAGVGAVGGAGAGVASTNAASGSTSTHHQSILREAYHEGEKLYHIKHNTGKHPSSTAGAATAGGVGAGSTSSYGHQKTPSTSSESSKGRLVSSPPRRSRKPLDHEIPGDFTNEKQPTDPSVLAAGAGAVGAGTTSSGLTSSKQSNPTTGSGGIISNDHPQYSDGAKQASGEGKFFDPKDTQGGALGAATSSDAGTNAYNERTKQNVTDFDQLKTKPSAYEQEERQQQELEEIKQLAYREGNKKGRTDIQSNPSLAGAQQIGGPTYDDSVDKNAIHQENKSAYNKDGVSGVLSEQGIKQEHKPKHKDTTANEPKYDHFGQPINPHTGTTGTSAAALGAGTAPTARGVSHTTHDPVEEQRRISELDQQINKTDARIKELRSDPSNASTYAVNDEPIRTPKLANVEDDDDETFVDTATGQHVSSKSDGPYDHSRVSKQVSDKDQYNSIQQATSPSAHQDTGVIATATGAVAAAAGYLGFNKTQSNDEHDFANIKDEAYKAGHKQGTDIWGSKSGSSQNKTTNTHPQDTTLTQAHAVGYQQGANESQLSKESSTHPAGYKTSTYQSGEDYGHELVDQARHAVEAAGATAAGILGYNTVTNAREGHKQLLDESYKAGQDKAHKEQSGKSGQEGYLSSALGALGFGGKETDSTKSTSSSSQSKTHNHNYGEDVPRDESLTKPSGGYVSIPKREEEVHRNPNKIPKDESLTKPDNSSGNSGVLASAGAAVGGAYNYLKGGNSNDSNTTHHGDYQVKDSLIADAEKSDPSIEKYPSHKVDKNALKEEESLGPNATANEKHVVDSNDDKKWQKETETYDRKHGFEDSETGRSKDSSSNKEGENTGVLAAAGAAAGAAVGGAYNYLKSGDSTSGNSNKNTTTSKDASDYNVHDSLIKDAVEADPAISKLPAHKGNKQELKEEKTLGPAADEKEKEVVSNNQFHELEDDVAKWNKQHGFKNPKSSLIEVAEESDPSIKKKSAHKGVSIDKEDSGNSAEVSGDNVQPLPSGLPSGRHSEIKENIGNASAVGNAAHKKSSTTDSNDDDKYKKASKQAAGAGVGGVGATEGSSGKDSSSSSSSNDKLDSSLKKQLYEHGYEKGKSSTHPTAGGAYGTSKSSKDDKLDASIKKQLYDQGYEKGKSSANHHNSGAAYNTTKPAGTQEYPLDKKPTDDAYSNHGVGNAVASGAGLVPGGVLGSAHTKEQVGREAHQEAQSHQQTLDPSLKQQIYQHGYNQGQTHGSSTVGGGAYNTTKPLGREEHTLDPSLKQQIYQHGYNHGKSHGSSAAVGYTGNSASGLDSKLKQDIYEHGHAKGSLEKKQERDSRVSNQPYGSSNREAAVIGGAGLGAAGLGAGAAAHQQHQGLHTPLDRNSELVEEKDAKTRSADSPADNLVVEVIGIEDKEEALRTAKKASKKLDEKGVDLTSGKLVINANTKEIYKTDGVTQETSTTPFDSDNHDHSRAAGAGLASAGVGGATGAAYGNHQQQSNVPETYGQSRAAGYTSGLDDSQHQGAGAYKRELDPHTSGQSRATGYTTGVENTHYRGEGSGATTNIDPATSGQARAAGYTSGVEDTHYRGDEVGKKTALDPNAHNHRTTGAGFSSGYPGESIDTHYRGDGAGKKTELDPAHHSSRSTGYDENEAAKQRLADAARRNVSSTQNHPEYGVLGGSGAGAAAGAASHHEGATSRKANDEIFVNVKGIKDNAVATKIAESAVKRLQKTHASVVAKVKEIQVDASSGVVRDENGDEIAHYPDLAIDPSGSHKKTSSSDYSHQPTSSSTHQSHNIGGGNIGAGAAGTTGLASAAAHKASNEHSNPHQPTRVTQANEHTTSKSQPPYPQGVPSTKESALGNHSATTGSSGNQTSSHLQGANAYPKSAVESHDSSESSLDKKIHETNISGRNAPSTSYTSGGNYTDPTGVTTNQAANFGGEHAAYSKGDTRDYQQSSGLSGTKAATNSTTTYADDADDEANTSASSYMPGSWV